MTRLIVNLQCPSLALSLTQEKTQFLQQLHEAQFYRTDNIPLVLEPTFAYGVD